MIVTNGTEIERTMHSFRRHEERGQDSLLTPQGKLDAEAKGRRIPYQYLLGLFHANPNVARRTKQTAVHMARGYFGYPTPKLIHQSKFLNVLDPPFPEGVDDKDVIFDHWMDNYYLVDGKPGDMYTAGANLIKHLLFRAVPVCDAKTGGAVVNISSSPNLESALITLLDSRMRMKDIGGHFDYGQKFEMMVDTDKEKDIIAVNVYYEGERKSVKPEKLHEIVNKQ